MPRLSNLGKYVCFTGVGNEWIFDLLEPFCLKDYLMLMAIMYHIAFKQTPNNSKAYQNLVRGVSEAYRGVSEP